MHPRDLEAFDADLDLALVGGMLLNELVANSRGLVDKPMQVQFISAAPRDPSVKLGDLGDGGPDGPEE